MKVSPPRRKVVLHLIVVGVSPAYGGLTPIFMGTDAFLPTFWGR